MIETRLMAPGQFSIKLEKPPERIKKLTTRFHAAVFVIPGQVSNPTKTGIAGIAAQAEYMGIHTGRAGSRTELFGYGPAYLLKLPKFQQDLKISRRPWYDGANNSWLRRLLRIAEGETNGLTVGPLTVAAGAASPTKAGKIDAGQEPLEVLSNKARAFGKEWTCDLGVVECVARSALFTITPTVVAVRGGGSDLGYKGLDAREFNERDDVDDWASTVAVPFQPDDWGFGVAYAVGDTVVSTAGVYYVATSAHTSNGTYLPGGTGPWTSKWDVIDPYGEASTGSPVYRSPLDAQPLTSRRVVVARNATQLADADTIADQQLGRYDNPQRSISLNVNDFDLYRIPGTGIGKLREGDNIYVFDPDNDLVDDTASIPFHGRRVPAATVRVQAMRRRVTKRKTVIVYSWDGSVMQVDDVTPWVAFEESGSDVLELGEPKRRRPTTAVTV